MSGLGAIAGYALSRALRALTERRHGWLNQREHEASLSRPAGAAADRGAPSPAEAPGHRGTRAESRTARARVRVGSPGARTLLCVAGEAGIGKTTLVETYLEKVRAQETSFVARGRCSERLAGGDVYGPFLEALGELLANRTAEQLLKDRAPSWYEQVKPRALADSAPRGARSQELLKRELSGFFEELSAIRPVIVFFDDLHWADASTVDVLAYLADRFDKLKVLFVATYRARRPAASTESLSRRSARSAGAKLLHGGPASFPDARGRRAISGASVSRSSSACRACTAHPSKD